MLGTQNSVSRQTINSIENGKKKFIKFTVQELPSRKSATIIKAEGELKTKKILGMSVSNLSNEEREKFGIKKYGVIVQNISGDPAQEAGLLKNDIIYQISGKNIQNIEQLSRIVKSMKKGDFASLLVRRSQNNSLYLAIQIE